jgi:hypothetical protein
MQANDLVIEETPAPERAPQLGRSLRLRPPQAVTMFMLCLIVGSALAGVYNEQTAVERVSIGGVDAEIEFTTRFRFQQKEIVSVLLHNNSGVPIDSLRVSVDTAYMAGFSQVSMVPSPIYPYASQLELIPPGESREVRVEARGDRFGRRRGQLLIVLRGDTVRVPLSTFVIP